MGYWHNKNGNWQWQYGTKGKNGTGNGKTGTASSASAAIGAAGFEDSAIDRWSTIATSSDIDAADAAAAYLLARRRDLRMQWHEQKELEDWMLNAVQDSGPCHCFEQHWQMARTIIAGRAMRYAKEPGNVWKIKEQTKRRLWKANFGTRQVVAKAEPRQR